MLIVTFCHQYMELWVPGKEVITQDMGTADTASLPWVCSGNAQCEPQEDPPHWPPGLEQWPHRWWTVPLETNQCIIWKQQCMWTRIYDSWIKIHGEPWKLSKFSMNCRRSVPLSELMRKKSLHRWLVYLKSCQSYTLPLTLQQQLRSQHPLAPVPEGSSASLIISASLIALLSILLCIPPPIPPHHPPFLNWLAALWFPNSFCIIFHRSPYTLVRVPAWQTPPAVVLHTF